MICEVFTIILQVLENGRLILLKQQPKNLFGGLMVKELDLQREDSISIKAVLHLLMNLLELILMMNMK
jgi:hypothetical protein